MKYFKKILAPVILLSLILLADSCISVKSDYPRINYYKLNQEANLLTNLKPVNVLLMVRKFTVGSEYDSQRMLAVEPDGSVKRYYYHRWMTECPEMITDFVINRLNKYNVFSGGVVGSSSISMADYFLEGQVLDMIARNSESNEPGKNTASITLKISLVRRTPMKAGDNVLLSKVYESSAFRASNSPATISDGISKALSEATDKFLSDILTAINSARNNP